MTRNIILFTILSLLLLLNFYPVLSLEVLYNVNDASGDVEPFISGHDINDYVSRIDITNVYVYVDGGAIIFELRFVDQPITPDEAVYLAFNKTFEYQFRCTVTVLIGGVLSNIQIVSEYGITSIGESEYRYMRAVAMILRGDEWLVPYLERNITISGSKMIIDIPLLVLEGLELKLPDPSQQVLYVEIYVMSPMDMATISDELDYKGGVVGDTGTGGEPTEPSGPTVPSTEEPTTTPEEEVEVGFPIEWAIATGVVLVAIIIILKFKFFK
jgi:hypothetical protein